MSNLIHWFVKIIIGPRDPFKWLVMQENTLTSFGCMKVGDNNSKMCVCGTVKVVK